MRADELIAEFQLMYREHWDYVWGAAEEGTVDCSGAFCYAYKLYGKSIAHGSNSIARKYITGGLVQISEAKPGYAAFKCRPWAEDQKGNTWYGTEPGDLHHIGLVDEDTRYVLNAKGQRSGFCRDRLTAANGWTHAAKLKDVEYEPGDGTGDGTTGGGGMEATVVLTAGTSGRTVNMREKPESGANLVERVPVGSVVTVAEDLGTWCRIRYRGRDGYMMSNFLVYNGQNEETETGGTGALTIADRIEIDRALKQIEEATEAIGRIVGRG